MRDRPSVVCTQLKHKAVVDGDVRAISRAIRINGKVENLDICDLQNDGGNGRESEFRHFLFLGSMVQQFIPTKAFLVLMSMIVLQRFTVVNIF